MTRFDEAKKLFQEAKTFAQSPEGHQLIDEAKTLFHHGDGGGPAYVHHSEEHHSHGHAHGTHDPHPHPHRHHHAGGEQPHVHHRDHTLHADHPEHAMHHRD